jgi:hypothetical protein
VQGTTFVLQKKTEPRQRLLTAISTGAGVREVKEKKVLLLLLIWDSLYQLVISFPITLAGNR